MNPAQIRWIQAIAGWLINGWIGVIPQLEELRKRSGSRGVYDLNTRKLEISKYFERIGYKGKIRLNEECLKELHNCHVMSIPFEAIDVQIGKPIELDLVKIFTKVIEENRGGYSKESFFVKNRICTMPTENGRKTIFNDSYRIKTENEIAQIEIHSESQFVEILKNEFSIEIGNTPYNNGLYGHAPY